MKLILLFSVLIASTELIAEEYFKMNFKNEELVKVIEQYSKNTGQKFIMDSSIRGKVNIMIPSNVSKTDAFDYLSMALSLNGYAISQQGDVMVIKSARNIQRDLIEVSTEVPTIRPERMYTWVYNVKNISAANIGRDIRTLNSKDGEIVFNANSNQIIFTDWVTNINRVAKLMKEIDIVNPPDVAKIVESYKKEIETRKASN